MAKFLALNILTCSNMAAVNVHRFTKSLGVILVVVLTLQFIALQPAKAQETPPTPTLAETINTVLSNISETNSYWNTVYDQIFCRQNATVFDSAINQAVNAGDYDDAVFIARLAEINNYTSQALKGNLTIALENIPMTGSLPITYEGSSFLLYDRYMVNAYRYAKDLGVSGWNMDAAYRDFVKAYVSPPKGSESGEMLYLNPQQGTAESYSSRYYDEHGETLSMFLLFALNGVSGAMAYADDAWLNTQTHWNGQIYGYTNKDAGVECEMGNFAQVIAQYRNSRGEIPYFNQVIEDLENTLLVNEFNSSAWGSPGVIKHADSNDQLRLGETMGNLIALQMLYQNFTETDQTHFQNMLQDGWRGLVSSSLVNNASQFRFVNSDGNYNDEASLLGAMTLFLYGIVPQTGSLAVDASNEKYQDYLTCFPTSKWQFNYTGQSIRIPVNKGNFTFIFGSQNATADFPEDGVYDVQFSSDWNNVTSTVKIENITQPQLQPVTLQPVEKHPYSSPSPTPVPPPTPKPSPTPTTSPTPTPTAIPTPTPEVQNAPSPTPTPQENGAAQLPFTLVLAAVLSVSTVVVFLVGAVRFTKGRAKKRN